MFSPALLSVMLHEAWKGSDAPPHPPFELDLDGIVRQITAMAPQGTGGELIPVVIQSRRPSAIAERLRLDGAIESEASNMGGLWGYVSLGRLARYLENESRVTAESDFLDLGPPIETSATNSAVEADLEARCERLFAKHRKSRPSRAIVAFIDEGRHVTGGTPNDFNGRLRHLFTTDVEMQPHALEVLAVLLERLDNRGVLGDVEIVCSLVVQKAVVGQKVFEHASAPDLLDAINRVGADLQSRHVPAVINISMGAHVGPHNGESPVEDACRTMLKKGPNGALRFVHVAAGNHGGSGVHARVDLRAAQTRHVALRTGPQGVGTILIENWWSEPPNGANLSLDIEARRIGGAPIMPPLRLTPASGQAVLTADSLGNTERRASLYAASCRKTFSCAAFELTDSDPFALANLELSFAFSSGVNLVVHSWITLDKGRQSAFITGGGPGDSLVVPATDPEVIAVSGATHLRQPWRDTSVGPMSTYVAYPFPPWGAPPFPPGAMWAGFESQPAVAHLAAFDSNPAQASATDWGTSYAAPRACADSVALLLDPGHRIVDRDSLLRALLARAPTVGWDPVLGFGCVPL